MFSSPTLYIGTDRSTLERSQTPILRYSDLADPTDPPLGSVMRRWDYVGRVGPSALSLSAQLPLRAIGDPLADAAIALLAAQGTLAFGVDLLAAVRDAAGNGEGAAVAFWEEMKRGPAMGGGAEKSDDLGAKAVEDEWRTIREGQDVFWRYSTQIFVALMHFSLAGGFSSPNLSAVMRETGYLTSASRDATYKRLLETTLFVIDAMTDLTPVTSRGWQSAVRVRLLHAQVRYKILSGKGREKTYSLEDNGVPINQADLALVLGSFMVAPIWSMRRMGLFISEREQKAYQAVWTHVGFYLGLSPDLIAHCYSPAAPFASSEVAFASLAFTAFPLPTSPAPVIYVPSTSTSTYRILMSVASRPPQTTSTIGQHLSYSRLLLGNQLADHLLLPHGTAWERANVWKEVLAGRALVAFGRRWRRGWEAERIKLMREVIELLVVWGLGERRTKYVVREEKNWGDKLTAGESDEPGIKMGKEVGMDVKWRWKLLLGEAVAVTAIGVALAGAGAALLLRAAF